jgi:hypothetical protein
MSQLHDSFGHTVPPHGRRADDRSAVRPLLFVWPIVAMAAMLPVLVFLIVALVI